MAVSNKYIIHQGPVIGGLLKTAAAAIKQRLSPPVGPVRVPGPVYRRTVAARPSELVRQYVRHVGGGRRDYRGHLPAHLFPQWGFPLSMRTLEGIPYPLLRVMNGGCRIEANAPIPADQPLDVSAQLMDIDDNGRRAVLHQRVVTATADHPEAVVGHFYGVVPLEGGSSSKGSSTDRAKPRVPTDATEVSRWSLPENAGLDFARLTGDFNPIHWLAPHARAFGFDNVILHGFSTMARAWEGLKCQRFHGVDAIEVLDVKFTRPLVLPHDVGLYVDGADGVYVGDALGGPAYMVGHYETDAA